ncbi:hypothetical protein WUBG_01647 [Wuchereria bancrofti]|uniref:Uncharacterized protein n=1 Tax=Wuchereria bancrofti TaxID=6293 RepID=J9EYY7_WUCBA|nr:hypothetical protein WUBG_01647 [Wuchereria bancrofti]
MSAANDTPADDKLKSRAVSSVNGSISEEEFYRFQEQLLELRSSNYGLLGENRRQKNYIEMSTEKVSLVAQVKVSNQELLSTKEVIVEGIDMERERSASLQRELQEAMEQYTNDKQFKRKKESNRRIAELA